MPEDVKPVKQPKVEEKAEAKPADSPATGATPKKKDSSALKIILIVGGVILGLIILGIILMVVFFNSVFDNAADVDNGTVTVQSDDGEVKTNVGEGAKLSEGFPTDVPIFEPSTLMASSKVDDTSFSVVAKTSKSAADVSSYYASEMPKQGWVTSYESSSTDGAFVTYTKDTRTVLVAVSTSEDEASDEKTGIVITVSTQP